ncbi:1-acylglycerol-3-phosphate O-acyltransferase [Bertholletia excelsa]
MESTRIGAFSRNRMKKLATDVYVDDDGWGSAAISCVQIVVCFVSMMITTFIWTLVMLVLLLWPCKRIRQGKIYGHVTERMLCSKERTIYISNHASPIGIFLIMWLTPTSTVGIVKKEIIWYPLFGQLYVPANHLRIDRSNPNVAIESMKEQHSNSQAASAIVKKKPSLIIFPEGTRSKNGRLIPLKKGFVHMALQSRFLIVPIVLTGTHLAWRKGSLHVRPTPLTIKYLPPIRANGWTPDKVDDYVEMVHQIYASNLPESQKPLT